ncbi:hypothetical protein KIW84_061648 [Lathyrus oleraceus]|uniref:Uncharacterized protein n=1 Tax=Pisum sativum TaxID=3888 RepID=A0A9D4W2Z8_PEA|nr:hypothetical protein KIW84_061648 [Pisum sativum]
MHSLKQIGDLLASLGSSVSIEDMTDYIPRDLDDGYGAVIDGVNARDNPITFDDLLYKLLIQELSIVVVQQQTHAPLTALNAQWCNVKGHVLSQCRTFRQQHPSIPPPPRDLHQVNTATAALPQTDYLVDSGSTHHITNDLANMAIHHPYTGPDSLLMGNDSDNGGEYIGLRPFISNHGISHHTTPPHTLEHNGISEFQNHHIVETGLALLHHSGLPLTYWPHAMTTAAYLINCLPTPILGLLGRSTCILVSRSSTGKIYTSRHVKFVESEFPFSSLATQTQELAPDSTLTSPNQNKLTQIIQKPATPITNEITHITHPSTPSSPIPNDLTRTIQQQSPFSQTSSELAEPTQAYSPLHQTLMSSLKTFKFPFPRPQYPMNSPTSLHRQSLPHRPHPLLAHTKISRPTAVGSSLILKTTLRSPHSSTPSPLAFL